MEDHFMNLRSGKRKNFFDPNPLDKIIRESSFQKSPYRDPQNIRLDSDSDSDSSEHISREMENGAWGGEFPNNGPPRPNETPQSMNSSNSPWPYNTDDMIQQEERLREVIFGAQYRTLPATTSTSAQAHNLESSAAISSMGNNPIRAPTLTTSANIHRNPMATEPVSVMPGTNPTPIISSAPLAQTYRPSPGMYDTRRLSAFPTLETEARNDNLLIAMMSRLDAGLVRINENLNVLNNRSHVNIVPDPQVQNQATAEPRNVASSSTVPNTPASDPIARLERMVTGLASQVQTLNERIGSGSVPSQDRVPENSSEFFPVRSNISSYKSYPHKWKLKYDGDNQKLAIEFFLDQVTTLKETNDVMWSDVLCCFPQFLEGDASKWFYRYRRTQESLTWDQLKIAMMTHFRGGDSDESLWCKIAKRRQGPNESFDTFYNSVLDIQDRLNGRLTDKQMIGILQENLRNDIQLCLISFDPKSLTEFVNKCRYTDRKLRPQLYQGNYSRRISEIETDLQNEDASPEIEAFASRRPFNPNSQANMRCWNCDTAGHNFVMCEEAPRRFCYWCGYKNVTCKNCPSCNSNFRSPHKIQDPPPSSDH